MMDELLRPAMDRCGVSYLQPYQELCVRHILAVAGLLGEGEREAAARRIVLLPTGYGKTLCFCLPALVLPRPTLVVYPLRALIADQERRFAAQGISCLALVGGLGSAELRARLDRIAGGGARLVLANPEIMQSPAVARALAAVRFSHLVLDEAHVIEQWGKTFRPAYLALAELLPRLRFDQLSAFTATADQAIVRGIREVIGDGVCYQLSAPSDRPEIHYRVILSPQTELSLLQLLRGGDPAARVPRPCIVFVRNRSVCQWLSLRLGHALGPGGVKFYHAGLNREEKLRAEHWFYHSRDGVLISTNAYGMGVDKPDIRCVVHLGLPDSPAAYLQESGRAGRDRQPAFAIAIERRLADDGQSAAPDSLRPFLDPRRCRRQSLNTAMGGGEIVCAGCDVCDGSASSLPPEALLLRDFIRRESRQHLPEELPAVLGRDRAFAHFSRNQIRQLVHNALSLGCLGLSRSPLSWHRLWARSST